jgi:methionyl-tRNA formyltransferase
VKVIVVTSVERGFASLCLPLLAHTPAVEVQGVILAGRAPLKRVARLRKIVRKVRAIGVRGAINGLRMRRWYTDDLAEALRLRDVREVAAGCGIRVEETPSVNAQRTAELIRASGADLGLSLGNGWIAPAVFERPRLGMLNVHHELLPEFQGAQSVLWAIHEGRGVSGFTIHRIARAIDTGDILWREEAPIQFKSTLRETVVATTAQLFERSAKRLAEVVASYEALAARAQPQGEGHRFTTPTWRQFQRMLEQHERLRGASQASAQGKTAG